jgi:hypothetical protein
MAMTKNEVLERAAAIWGLKEADIPNTKISQTPSGRTRYWVMFPSAPVHMLDGNGHPTCHESCNRLEAAAYAKKLLK